MDCWTSPKFVGLPIRHIFHILNEQDGCHKVSNAATLFLFLRALWMYPP